MVRFSGKAPKNPPLTQQDLHFTLYFWALLFNPSFVVLPQNAPPSTARSIKFPSWRSNVLIPRNLDCL
ncbi:MAG: hypothetical protein U5L45_00190 [Saprospiraceae bacterium]|nr:hypothetical protein [Saprospiraceae bacterium]